MILGNSRANLNYRITEGKLTSSDHIPLVVELSTRAIRMPVTTRYNLRRADWEAYKDRIEDEINGIPPQERELNGQTKEEIDRRMEKWCDAVERGTEVAIPINNVCFNAHHKNSDLLNILTTVYRNIKEQINNSGVTPQLREIIKTLQINLTEEYSRLHSLYWEAKILKINNMSTGDAEFWKRIRILRGGMDRSNRYLKNSRNEKITDPKEKVQLLKSIWGEVFQITDEENSNFDQAHETRINNFLMDNLERIQPYNQTDLTRLDGSTVFTTPITETRILVIIKNFKQKAPGPSGITKKNTLLTCLQLLLLT